MRAAASLRIVCSAGLVVFILWRVPAEALWSAFRALNVPWVWPALATSLATLGVRTVKWRRLLRAAGSRALPRDITRSLFGGFALAIVTPGRVGEFGRCLFVPEPERASTLPLTVLDRVLDSWSVVSYAVVSLFFFGWQAEAIFALAVWLAILPIVFGLPRFIARLGAAPRWNDTFRTQVRAASEVLGTIRVAPFAVWALVSTSLDVLTFFFLLRAFHAVGFSAALATYPWVVIASGIPLTLAGLGLREGAAALLLARYGIPAPVATDVALFLFAFLGLLPGFIGGVWLLAWPRGNAATLSADNTPEILSLTPSPCGARRGGHLPLQPGTGQLENELELSGK